MPDPKGKGHAPLTLDSNDGGSNAGDHTDGDKPLQKQRPASNFIYLDDDDDDGPPPLRSVSQNKIEVIDLTLSDDDDDAPLVARSTVRPNSNTPLASLKRHGYAPSPGQPGTGQMKSSDDDQGLGGGSKRSKTE